MKWNGSLRFFLTVCRKKIRKQKNTIHTRTVHKHAKLMTSRKYWISKKQRKQCINTRWIVLYIFRELLCGTKRQLNKKSHANGLYVFFSSSWYSKCIEYEQKSQQKSILLCGFFRNTHTESRLNEWMKEKNQERTVTTATHQSSKMKKKTNNRHNEQMWNENGEEKP